MEGGVKCIKYLMFAFNLLFVITGIALIASAAVIQIFYAKYLDFLGQGFSAPLIFICAGCVIFLVSFFGCCGAAKESNVMLIIFGFLLTILLLVEIGSAIAGYIFLGKVRETVEPLMVKTLNGYGIDDNKGITETWDFVQHESHCCGISGYMDWQNSTWAKDKLSGSVPDSCCKVYSANCGEIVADTSINPAIYTEGCLPKFVHYVQSNGSTFAGVALGLSLVQILGIIFSCLLAKGIRGSYEAV